jgi:hypothetical protein
MAEERRNSDLLEYINKLLDDGGTQSRIDYFYKHLPDDGGGGSVVELPPELKEKKTLTDDELYEKIIKRFPEADPEFDRDYFREVFKIIKDRFLVKPNPDGIPAVPMPNVMPDLSPEEMDRLKIMMEIRKRQSLERDPSGMTQLLGG